ncbi:MAG: hypothetical protein LBR27_06205 [Bifidobacteriaceae bacterium]|jgi:6-phospho-beta-glucosidase|nr:hypothetical protein [Bifidobacteriaceae bacterium]
MARIKIAYLGGGSTRAPGTMASFIWRAAQFAGSEIVLIDLDAERLELVHALAVKMAAVEGADLTITATTDRRAGVTDCDAVLSSFRPGCFEARALDERIPLKHGVIGQETQGPGGFFMALRSIHVVKDLINDLNQVAPKAVIFNYTNPVNIVAQAVTSHTDTPLVSLCEGPIIFPEGLLRACGLDPARADVVMAGVNHNCWSWRHTYDGQDLMPLLDQAWAEHRDDPAMDPVDRRLLHLAVTMRSVPAGYYQFYYFKDEVLREQQAAPTTRAEDILAWSPGYWAHYREQLAAAHPRLDPARSRGGIHELELAIDAMSAYYNDTGQRLPVNLPNRDGALPGFDNDTVVEVWCRVDRQGFHIEPQEPLPHAVRGITQQLAEYQRLAAEAAWSGGPADAVRALAANPLVPSVPVAEALYAEMAAAHARYLPDRLVP